MATLLGNLVVQLLPSAFNEPIYAANIKISASDDAEHTISHKSVFSAVALRMQA